MVTQESLMSVLKEVTGPEELPMPLPGWGPLSTSGLYTVLKQFDLWVPMPKGHPLKTPADKIQYLKSSIQKPQARSSSAPRVVLPYSPVSTNLQQKLEQPLSEKQLNAIGALNTQADQQLTLKIWHYLIIESIVEDNLQWYFDESLRQTVFALIALMNDHLKFVKELEHGQAMILEYEKMQEKIIEALIESLENEVDLSEDDLWELHHESPFFLELEPEIPPITETDETLNTDVDEEAPKPMPPKHPIPLPVDRTPSITPPAPSNHSLAQIVTFSHQPSVQKHHIDNGLKKLQEQRDKIFLQLYNEARTFCSQDVQLIKTLHNHPLIKNTDLRIKYYQQQIKQLNRAEPNQLKGRESNKREDDQNNLQNSILGDIDRLMALNTLTTALKDLEKVIPKDKQNEKQHAKIQALQSQVNAASAHPHVEPGQRPSRRPHS